MKTLFAILLLCAVAHGEQVALTWDAAEPPTTNLVGYAVLLATNGGAWKTNAIRPAHQRAWTNDLPAGQWTLGVQTLVRAGSSNETYVWSCGFNVRKRINEYLTFSGPVQATVLLPASGTNIVFWMRPSALTNDFSAVNP